MSSWSGVWLKVAMSWAEGGGGGPTRGVSWGGGWWWSRMGAKRRCPPRWLRW